MGIASKLLQGRGRVNSPSGLFMRLSPYSACGACYTPVLRRGVSTAPWVSLKARAFYPGQRGPLCVSLPAGAGYAVSLMGAVAFCVSCRGIQQPARVGLTQSAWASPYLSPYRLS